MPSPKIPLMMDCRNRYRLMREPGLVERRGGAADPAGTHQADDAVAKLLLFEEHEHGQDDHEARRGERVKERANRGGKSPENGGFLDRLDRDRFLALFGGGLALDGFLDVLDRFLHLLDCAAPARAAQIDDPLTNGVTIGGELVGERPQLAGHAPRNGTHGREAQNDNDEHGRQPPEVSLQEGNDGTQEKGEQTGQGDRHQDRLTEVEDADHQDNGRHL